MSEEAVLERARRARAVLNDATVTEAFDFIADRLTADWRNTNGAQAAHREVLHAQIAGLDSVRRQLAAWVDQAKGIEIKRERDAQRKAASPMRLVRR